MKTKTINYIEYVNYLHKLGLCKEIKSVDQLHRITESDVIKNRLDTFVSTIPMIQDNEYLYEIRLASFMKEELTEIAKILDQDFNEDNFSTDDSLHIYSFDADEEPFDSYVHQTLAYILKHPNQSNLSLYFASIETGIYSYVMIDASTIAFNTMINTTETYLKELDNLNVFENYILTIVYSLYHLLNNDIFSKNTEVIIEEDLYEQLEIYLKSQQNFYSIDKALDDYPEMFSDISQFRKALTINPKLFLEAPKEILENPEWLQTFLEVIRPYEDKILNAVTYNRIYHNDPGMEDTTSILTSEVFHKNSRFIPSMNEMAKAYQNSLSFLRKKATHKLLAKSFAYYSMICLTENQFNDKNYMTRMQREVPFFFTNIYFYHAFYNLGKRKYSKAEQIEKDSSTYLSDTIKTNLLNFFNDECRDDEQFAINLNYAILDIMSNFGIFMEDDLEDEDEETLFEELRSNNKKYFS